MAGILNESVPSAPAPWSLKGEGYMVFYKFKRDFIERNGFLPSALQGKFDGFFGALMLVQYHESPVGPYRELLFIPGKFQTPHGRLFSITNISVDSEASTQNGRANWGIPKITHTFDVSGGPNQERISVLAPDNKPFFEATLRSGGLSFPISTAFVPLSLYQVWEGQTYLTTPQGKGWAQLASIRDIRINADYFPDISTQKPLLALKVKGFSMKFPVAIQPLVQDFF
jgi:hypothetical protein